MFKFDINPFMNIVEFSEKIRTFINKKWKEWKKENYNFHSEFLRKFRMKCNENNKIVSNLHLLNKTLCNSITKKNKLICI